MNVVPNIDRIDTSDTLSEALHMLECVYLAAGMMERSSADALRTVLTKAVSLIEGVREDLDRTT